MPSAIPGQILQEALQTRITKNPSYSLRALSRDLGVSHTFLSLVMTGKKSLSVERASQIAELMGFTKMETKRFVQAVVLCSPARRGGYGMLKQVLAEETRETARADGREIEFFELEQDRFRAVNGWWHWAILDLMTCADARSDHGWIAKRIGISQLAARDAIERLLRLGLLEVRQERWVKTRAHVMSTARRPDTLMRLFHRDLLAKSLHIISEETGPEDVARRDLLSMTVAINPTRLERARTLVDEFQKKIVACLTEGPCTEVYQMNLQLLPLTRLRKERT